VRRGLALLPALALAASGCVPQPIDCALGLLTRKPYGTRISYLWTVEIETPAGVQRETETLACAIDAYACRDGDQVPRWARTPPRQVYRYALSSEAWLEIASPTCAALRDASLPGGALTPFEPQADVVTPAGRIPVRDPERGAERFGVRLRGSNVRRISEP